MALLLLVLTLVFAVPQCTAFTNTLYAGYTLRTLDHIETCDFNYALLMQLDCNLVLYDYSNTVWSSNTLGKGRRCYCNLQLDGALLIYDGEGLLLWSTNASNIGQPVRSLLVIQNNRDLVVYVQLQNEKVERPIWSSHTKIGGPYVPPGGGVEQTGFGQLSGTNTLYSGHSVSTLNSLVNQDYSYALVMKIDCNLVLYDFSSAIWASNTLGMGRRCFFKLHDNGNLVVHGGDGVALWASNSNGSDMRQYKMVLEENRNLVIYMIGMHREVNRKIWSTETELPGSREVKD